MQDFKGSVDGGTRTGMTLIEVLVVIAVIGLLVALLLPAVQAARDGARKAQCASNLRQLALAFHAYDAVVGTLPSLVNGKKGFSALAMILPQIEQGSLFSSLNFNVSRLDAANHTAERVTIQTLLCPADKQPGDGPLPWTSFACNSGWNYQNDGRFNGAFLGAGEAPVGIASIVDGASSTSLMAEWVSGDAIKGLPDPLRVTYQTERLDGKQQIEQFVESCKRVDYNTTKNVVATRGRGWSKSSLGYTAYNHNMTVNGKSCLNGGLTFEGAWTASSRHGGGANVAFADGHVRFMRDTVDVRIWRGMSTRSGGESSGPVDP